MSEVTFDTAQEQVKGTVKWFSAQKGYGFITAESGRDYYVHYSEIIGTGFRKLTGGENVEFEIGQDRDGRDVAKNVVRNEGFTDIDNPGYGGYNSGIR
ncbi:MAG: cold shock domain-containing protein [Lachnospiraceae bacterium]|nr:cold shock domain-containing protein [Lachnospiraceae bacterium]